MSRTSAFHVVAVLSFVLPAFLLTGCGGVPVHKTASGMVIAEAGYTSRLPSPDHEPITLPADNAIYVSLEENQPTVSGASQWKHTLRFWDTGQVLWVNELWLENSGAAGRLDTTPQPDIVSFESEHDLAGNAVAGAYVVDGSDIYIQILERVPQSGFQHQVYRGTITEDAITLTHLDNGLYFLRLRHAPFGDQREIRMIRHDVEGLSGKPSW